MNKAKPWLVGALLAVACWVFWSSFLQSPPELSRAYEVRRLALEQLATHLLPTVEGKRVLVLSNPFTQERGKNGNARRFEEAAIAGLRQGFGDEKDVLIVFPSIKPEYREHPERAVFPPDSKTPLSFLMEPSAVDQLVSEYPDCTLIVSLVGLPIGIENQTVWKGAHRFGLLLPDLRILGSKRKAASAFQDGKLLAAVVNDPQTDEPLIVDSSNIEQILADRPKLLGFKQGR